MIIIIFIFTISSIFIYLLLYHVCYYQYDKVSKIAKMFIFYF